MRYVRWVVWNTVIVGIIIDGLLHLSSYSHFSENLIPFLTCLLAGVSFLCSGVLLIAWVMSDEIKGEERGEWRAKIKRTPKALSIINAMIDIPVIFLMASFGFYFSAVAYLLHWIFGSFGVFVKNRLYKELNP